MYAANVNTNVKIMISSSQQLKGPDINKPVRSHN